MSTPFPDGLEPFEDNRVEAMPDGPFAEGLRTTTIPDAYLNVHGRGFVLASFDTVWAVARAPEPHVKICETSEQVITPNNEPAYEFSFLVHYIVRNILTVEWDDQWRFGRIGDDLAMMKHQKTQGSDFVALSEGTIQLLATSDPGVVELQFVEHLDAVSAGAQQVIDNMNYNYEALAALARGDAIPSCP